MREKKTVPVPLRFSADDIIGKRLVFVSGKGGTGKTTISAAIALLASRAGKRVLAIDVMGKGNLAAALGFSPVGFEPHYVSRNLHVMQFDPNKALQEYLHIFFKIPAFVQLSPLSHILDFVASGVPGPKDLLLIGKMTFEEKRKNKDGSPAWDLVVVDSPATGHFLPMLTTPQEMKKITEYGMIQEQVSWMDNILQDHDKTAVLLCALPDEMAVTEVNELYRDLIEKTDVLPLGCVVNKMIANYMPENCMDDDGAIFQTNSEGIANEKVDHAWESIRWGAVYICHLQQAHKAYEDQLKKTLPIPIVSIPFQLKRSEFSLAKRIASILAKDLRYQETNNE